MNQRITYVEVSKLREHEETLQDRVAELCKALSETKIMNCPILVDSKTNTILDGHHRCKAARECGMSTVPCLLVDYLSDENISVCSWRKGESICKEMVIEAARTGTLFSPKTSRHVFQTDPSSMGI